MDESDGDNATRRRSASVGWELGICRLGGPRKMAFSVFAAVMQACHSRARKKKTYSILVHNQFTSGLSSLRLWFEVEVDQTMGGSVIRVRGVFG